MPRRLGWRTFIALAFIAGARALASLRLAPQHRRGRKRATAWIALSIWVLVCASSCSTPESIDRLTIVNRTEFDVEVQVSDAKKESWQILSRALHETSTVNELVTDEGSTWVFQFHHAGKLIDELTVTRSDLDRNKWRVEVPTRIEERLRRLGFDPPPGP